MNVTLNWVGFQLSQIKGTICKIRKEYIKNIPFQRKKQMNTLETNSSLLQSFSILEEKIEKYIGDGLTAIDLSIFQHLL